MKITTEHNERIAKMTEKLNKARTHMLGASRHNFRSDILIGKLLNFVLTNRFSNETTHLY
jgi:hypothetical protein